MLYRSIATIISVLSFLPIAQAMERPYRVALIGDAFDGKAWHTGILIELDEGWKTYWRMPGEAGIPPDFTWKMSVAAEIDVNYPTPGRYHDASGETVGYEREVIFPVTVSAGHATSVNLDLSLFFAVCKDVCIPAKADVSIMLGPAVKDRAGAARVEQALATVPKPGKVITAASVMIESGKPILVLALVERADDIFVEATSGAYFRGPRFSADGREARLVVDNIADAAKLKGAMLKVTLSTASGGLEQNVSLP